MLTMLAYMTLELLMRAMSRCISLGLKLWISEMRFSESIKMPYQTQHLAQQIIQFGASICTALMCKSKWECYIGNPYLSWKRGNRSVILEVNTLSSTSWIKQSPYDVWWSAGHHAINANKHTTAHHILGENYIVVLSGVHPLFCVFFSLLLCNSCSCQATWKIDEGKNKIIK